MDRIHVLLCLFGISVCLFAKIVAREAIVGGELASYNDFNYHVTIVIADHAPDCGGGIIKEQYVVTAAHCVIVPNGHLYALRSHNLSILAGIDDLLTPGIFVEVEKVYVPLEYRPRENNIIGDIAILQLKEPLEMEKHNLKMLHMVDSSKSSYAHKVTKIAGFGWDTIDYKNELFGLYTDYNLRFARATVLDQMQCHHDHPSEGISPKHLCARVIQQERATQRCGVCYGDHGGPLVYKSNTVIGILSKSTIGCSEQISSGIYIRISHYRSLVRHAINRTSIPRSIRVFDV